MIWIINNDYRKQFKKILQYIGTLFVLTFSSYGNPHVASAKKKKKNVFVQSWYLDKFEGLLADIFEKIVYTNFKKITYLEFIARITFGNLVTEN